MKFLARLLATLLLAAVVSQGFGQLASLATPPPSKPQPTQAIQGIKIIESSFDPATDTAKIVFINDTTLDITAWVYCIHSGKNTQCNAVESGFTSLDVATQNAHRKYPIAPDDFDCDGCHPIRPGQSHTGIHIVTPGTTFTVEALVFSDGSYSSTKLAYPHMHAQITEARATSLKIATKQLELVNKVLNDPADKNPLNSLIEMLRSRAHYVGTPMEDARIPEGLTVMGSDGKKLTEWPEDGVIKRLKQPGWREGNTHEYTPTDQRGYLQEFVVDTKIWVDYMSQNQVRDNGREQ